MKITLLTAASKEHWPILNLTAPDKMEYCLRYQLQLSIRKHEVLSPWHEREDFMKDALSECDWLWFMGADTLIMNHTINVESLIDTNYDFIIGQDYNGINNDVFFLRNCPESFKFIEEVTKRNTDLSDDQVAMFTVKDQIENFKYKIVPQKQFNCYLYDTEPAYTPYPKGLDGNFRDGDFVLHLPGMDIMHREVLLKEYVNKVIK
jgi:hypothetical protein